jgi:hypothetical protein
MVHIKLLNQVRSKEIIIVAFKYALNDRLHNDSYFAHLIVAFISLDKSS